MSQASQPGKAYSYLMMAGHTVCDMNQSTVPAILPFLVFYRGFDYAAAAGLMFASNFLSSLIQPLMGMFADRKQMPQLMGIGILMTGLGIAAIGFLDSYWGIFAVIMFSGLGSAVFHPEGGRMANCVAGDKKGQSLANFATGGKLGFVFGPVLAVLAVSLWGLQGTAVVLIPTFIIVAILFSLQKKLMHLSNVNKSEVRKQMAVSERKDDWPGLGKLSISIFSRSIVNNGLNTFIPLYWVGVLMQTRQQGSLMLTVIAVSAAAATFVGGRLADRYGFSRIIRLTFGAVFPLIVLIPLTNNVWIATALVLPLAATLNLGLGPSVALGQKYLPNRVGMASGITLGLAVSVGGISAPFLGAVGDNFGLTTVMFILAGVGLFGFFGTLLLKEPATAAKIPETTGR